MAVPTLGMSCFVLVNMQLFRSRDVHTGIYYLVDVES